ncbi:MAG TPA: isochorismatase family protein [Kofleriaceae bacterium]|nr:isochorismatase family protein [Kofleriaceae bacterium]
MTTDRGSEIALAADRAALLVVDVQDRLAAAMPPDDMARLTRNVGILVEAARRFSIPVVVSQQYPRGLGATIPGVEQALAGLAPERLHRFDKVEFSACAAPGFAAVEQSLDGRDQWIVTGMECHICVYQTARALRGGGAAVHVVRDAVVSRTAENRATGLTLIERTGAVVTSTETVIFDLLQRAGSDDFKALSRLIV